MDLKSSSESIRHRSFHRHVLSSVMCYMSYVVCRMLSVIGHWPPVICVVRVRRFVPSEWGPCSATCGPGVRRRQVQCKMFSQKYGAVINQPSAVCTGEWGQRAGTAGRDSGLGQRAGTAGQDSWLGQRAGTAGRDRGPGQRAGTAGRDSGQGQRAGTAGRDSGPGQRAGTAGRDSGPGQLTGTAGWDSGPGQRAGHSWLEQRAGTAGRA